MGASGVRGESINGLTLDVDDAAAGAVVTFRGVVRNHDGGRSVDRIEYVGHPSAGQVVREIVAEARGLPGIIAADAVHRVGLLEVGDVAIVVGVSSAHRADSFAACMWIVDEVKKRLPVWKNQRFSDGTNEWTGSP